MNLVVVLYKHSTKLKDILEETPACQVCQLSFWLSMRVFLGDDGFLRTPKEYGFHLSVFSEAPYLLNEGLIGSHNNASRRTFWSR